MPFLTSSDGKYKYTEECQKEYQFTHEEEAQFREWDRLLDDFSLRQMDEPTDEPAPVQDVPMPEWLRFQAWRMWQLSRNFPTTYADMFEPI